MDRLNEHEVYAFDAYGTLFDVHSAVSQVAGGLGDDAPHVSALWRQKQLEYSWVRTLANRYRDFEAVTEDALAFALRRFQIDDEALRTTLMRAYRRLAPYPEVRAVLEALRRADKRVVIFSNGTPDMLTAAVASAGLTDLIHDIVSTHSTRAFKTRLDVYGMVCERCRVDKRRVSFQSSNRWDIAGATAFGFHTVWVNRTNEPDEYPDLPPNREIASLEALRCSSQPAGRGRQSVRSGQRAAGRYRS